VKARWKNNAGRNAVELAGILVLALLAAWFLHASWRKWPDPIIDSGPQCYNTWRVSLGALPYHDFHWNYGPLSILCNALLFKCLGPGVMVLAAANLAIYAAIVALGYLAFRMAWGPLAAFAAGAVFISVFSFSMLNTVGNYNYVLPYSNETTHGMLLILLTAFVMERWCRGPSGATAFLLGLGGGIAVVLKPEFMLATGLLGLAALFIRCRQHQPPGGREWGWILAGLILPVLLVAAWFARRESWPAAWVDSSQAWLAVLVSRSGPGFIDQSGYDGFNHGWRNLGWELIFSLNAALLLGAIWAVGWLANRPWRPLLRWIAALGALALASMFDMGGGFEIGPSFPGLIAVVLVIFSFRWQREWRQNGRTQPRTIMALALILLAAAMLTRMVLRARINHFGFIQAALAGMVLTAVIVAEIPRWTGTGLLGRRIALLGFLVMLAMGSMAVVTESAGNHVLQYQPVADGADRFYAFGPAVDETGAVVQWCVERMKTAKPSDTLLVLPEGVMINYLSRHERPMPEFTDNEPEYIKQLAQVRPDYVIVIWGDQRDGGINRFGDPGQPGEKIEQWLRTHYTVEDTRRGRVEWAFVMRQKPNL
jgi:hypothetical protein